MTARPKVSVVTISFRDLEGLKRTVDSVRAQVYDGELEHIVIDGGSGDEVKSYLTEHQSGFAHWQSEPDGGRYDAMNQGIARASGDVIWLMHSSDCFSDPKAVAAVADTIAERGATARRVWGYGVANRVDGQGRLVNVWESMPFDLVKFATGRLPIPHQATFVGTELCREIGPYDLGFGVSADQLYILTAARLQPPITVPRVVCDFDVTGEGSQLNITEIFDNFRSAYDLLDYYPMGSRRKSLAYLKFRELQLRAAYGAYRLVTGLRSRWTK